jgi:hypothetical protein
LNPQVEVCYNLAEATGIESRTDMSNIIVQFVEDEDAKALPILLRHSAGTILGNRTYVVNSSVGLALHAAGVEFREFQPHLHLPAIEDFSIGDRSMTSLYRCGTTTANPSRCASPKSCRTSCFVGSAD